MEKKTKFVLALLSMLLIGSVIRYGAIHIHRLENIDNSASTLSSKEALWKEQYPTKREIEDFLHNKTFLIFHPPTDNRAEYFNMHNEYLEWHDNTIYHGVWRLKWQLLPLTYNGNYRFVIANIYCRVIQELRSYEPTDNCFIVHRVDDLIAVEFEERSGDVFDLEKASGEIKTMPNGDISFDELLSYLSKN